MVKKLKKGQRVLVPYFKYRLLEGRIVRINRDSDYIYVVYCDLLPITDWRMAFTAEETLIYTKIGALLYL